MSGPVLVNPFSGEELTVVRGDDPDLLVLESRWPLGQRTPPHLHPAAEERFTVLEGEAALRAGSSGEARLARGESYAVAPGVPHVAWNPTDGPVRVRLEFRPALRWLAFVERLCALAPTDGPAAAALAREFSDVVRPVPADF